MIVEDSIHTTIDTTVSEGIVEVHPTRPQTPYQVLRSLPKDATPAQQDSAIQAWLEPREIRYSEQPDTLHLPGESIPKDLKVVNLPQYYRENFFSNDTLYHEELSVQNYFGMAGDPVPYSYANDNLVTSLLIIGFLIIAFSFSRMPNFIVGQTKNFIHPSKNSLSLSETSGEIYMQIALTGLTCIVYALLYYLYATEFVAKTYVTSSEYVLLSIFFGMFVGYYLLRFGLYTIVNNLFFNSSDNKNFLTSLLYISTLEGLLLYPVLALLASMHLPAQNAIWYCIAVLVLVKIMTFYKSFTIFFKQNGFFLQIILYFCALEMIPLITLWGGLSVIVDILKINF
jgi:hypothetical protein